MYASFRWHGLEPHDGLGWRVEGRWLVVGLVSLAIHALLVSDLRWTWLSRRPAIPPAALQVRIVDAPRAETVSSLAVPDSDVAASPGSRGRLDEPAPAAARSWSETRHPGRMPATPVSSPRNAKVAAASPATGRSKGADARPSVERPAEAGPFATTAAAAEPGLAQADPVLVGVDPLPRYATRFARATTARFAVTRGAHHGEGVLAWRPEGDGYTLTFDAPELGWWQSSEGGFDATGLAPQRYLERLGRGTRATNFEADAGRVRFSAARGEQPWQAGGQDRLGWIVQLGAVLVADPTLATAGRRIVIAVAGVRGDVARWEFAAQGAETPPGAGDGAPPWWRLSRVPAVPHDLSIEVWFDPGDAALPARIEWRSPLGVAVWAWERLVTGP